MTTKKGGAVRPSLDIVNARSRCPREVAPLGQIRKVLRVAARRGPRRRAPPGAGREVSAGRRARGRRPTPR